jgi:hypothetical protein
MIIYIYALGEPGTSEVRYVGKTANLQQRLSAHLADVTNSKKGHWLQELRAQDKKPTLMVLETLDCEDKFVWIECEKKWIAHFKQLGFVLLNESVGGEGSNGFNLSLETKEKMSLSHTGLRTGQDARIKQSRNNSHRKLTDDDIAAIHERCPYPGAYSYTLLAQEYGVARSTISRVVNKKSFKDNAFTLGERSTR